MSPNAGRPIALFDSGVGGLTVFKALCDILPNESLIYLGDTARVPYGTRSQPTISRYTLMAAEKLSQYGVKMLVIACNTASSVALPLVAEKFAPIPVCGVVEPGALAASKATANGHIAVIATEATIMGQAYQKAICAIMPDSRILARACTLFVPLAEEGWISGAIAEDVIRRYLGDVFPLDGTTDHDGPDTLLLGCTHFPLFLKTFKKMLGPGIKIIDPALATAQCVKSELEKSGILRQEDQPPQYRFLTTDNPLRFARTGSLFLGQDLTLSDIELVDL